VIKVKKNFGLLKFFSPSIESYGMWKVEKILEMDTKRERDGVIGCKMNGIE